MPKLVKNPVDLRQRRWANALRLSQVLATCVLLAMTVNAAATGTAYGSINNFDTVNDAGVPCHGFEIELEDIESKDITYTYDWNHYGTPKITEDTTSVPGHTNVIVRYAAVWANDAWSAYTAVPAGPIAPTDGHQFTNPNVNFGGEHFGVGYRRPPSAVKYHWLIEGGVGVLVHGGAVNIATPVFSYVPPVAGAAAQVQAVIEPPEPPEVPVLEFGPATWVKEIRTTTHNHNEVKLRDLVSDDPDDDDDKNWRNGEPDEIEVEWQLLQREFSKPDGGEHGKLAGAPEALPDGDEVVTRRYEFYEYVGPLDEETGEAKASKVGPDGVHGEGIKEINGVEVDLATVAVVGGYMGSQMAAFDVESALGLIDHLEDGIADIPYTPRTVVIAGNAAFTVTTSGTLPEGMTFDAETGLVAGTPTSAGVFSFGVTASVAGQPPVMKNYNFAVTAPGEAPLARFAVDAVAEPVQAGSTTGSGLYVSGEPVTVTATSTPGFTFLNWTENGRPVSDAVRYEFTPAVNRSLVANFVPDALAPLRLSFSAPNAATLVISWPTNQPGFKLQRRNAVADAAGWSLVETPPTVAGTNYQTTITPLIDSGLFRALRP